VPDTRLGDLLAAAVPEPPLTIDASEVLRRARRRARLRGFALVATAISAVVAVVVAVAVFAGGQHGGPDQIVPGTTKPPAPSAGSSTEAPSVVGLDVDAAVEALTRADCAGSVGAIVNDGTAPVGQVVAQRRTSDLCEVALTVSAGPGSSALPCTSLDISAGAVGVGLGHAGFPLRFRNVGSADCALEGHARVTARDSVTGRTVVARDDPSGYLGGTDLPVPTYVLRPGDEVSAFVEGTNVPPGNARSCSSLVQLRVTVDGVTVRVSPTLYNCSGMEVHPYVPGTTGSAR